MTHTSTEQPAINELCQWFNEGDGFKQGTAAPHKWVLQANSEISRQHARIAELESQLSAIGAIGVEPLRKQAVRRAPVAQVPQSIEQMAVDRYKVVPSHSSMFYPCAVVAGDGQQLLYIGREAECQNMARKFTGAFLDGAFVTLAAAPQPVAQGLDAPNEWEDIRTLPTCDDLIWLYCQDSNTIDGPIAPEPNLEEYGWTHWAYANAPSTAWIDAALAAKAKLNVK